VHSNRRIRKQQGFVSNGSVQAKLERKPKRFETFTKCNLLQQLTAKLESKSGLTFLTVALASLTGTRDKNCASSTNARTVPEKVQ
jgi:hypothetical protein